MKSKQILLYALIFLSMGAWAQKKITGKVTDFSNSETLPGVNVLIKGNSSIGTVTDVYGRFTITVPDEKSTLVFSFIGFTPQEVFIGKQTQINVQLKTSVQGLDEVVVIGYGTMKKSDLSGASVSLSEANVKGSINSGLDQALQGRAAGVTAVQTSG